MACGDPAVICVDGVFIFPFHTGRGSYDPVDIPITGLGLQNLPAGPAHVTLAIHTWGYPDSNFNWHYDGWFLRQDFELRYESRDDTHLLGVTKYPTHGKIENLAQAQTGYYNPNAYWTPPAPGPPPPPPPGADPGATYGQDPATLVPPDHTVYVNRPYHYADLKIYDLMGVNRTGDNLAPDPDNVGAFLDPYDIANNPITFLYDDQDADGSNLANMDWEPDGENVRNQQVSLMSANKEGARGIRKIARNIPSWREIGIYSGWDSVGGSNVTDVSEDNVAGHAKNEVERYGRPPNFFKLYLHIEPVEGTPVFGEIGWKPQPFRDFNIGDRIKARCRKGYMDSGLLVGRIMNMKVGQADMSGNVQVELDCVPHTTDVTEIGIVE